MQVLFPAVGFLVLSAWALGVLNSHRRFFLSYVAPALFNVVQVGVLVGVGLTVLEEEFSVPERVEAAQTSLVTWLAVGTVVGGLLQFLVQLPTVLRVSRGLRLSLRTDLPGVRATLRAFGPVVTGRGVVQVSTFLQVVLASFLAAVRWPCCAIPRSCICCRSACSVCRWRRRSCQSWPGPGPTNAEE